MMVANVKSTLPKIGSKGKHPKNKITYKFEDNNQEPKRYHVSVEFFERLTVEQVSEKISQLSNPQIIIWYIGCYGLRKAGVQFYRECLINPILKHNLKAVFWLVDLTAWNAFKNPKLSIEKISSCCEIIEKFSEKRINCIKSAKIFKKMQEITEKKCIEYFKKALCRNFLLQVSKEFPKKNISVGEIFFRKCELAEAWYDCDASTSYSLFQYLEGCLLVDEVFIQGVLKDLTDSVQIVFALPNDELKYYQDNQGSFQKDVEFLIARRCSAFDFKKIKLDIKFFAFEYGSSASERPYNACGEIFKSENLLYEEIVGSLNKNENANNGL